ncbi:serine/threonine-protein kinase [Actinomycetospora lemnae]|uniref:non-specific serine/threonine protein kinase n=1 Tax=Actinomycetospora lemnae TaxID=3019891 RepID=A0ABT5SXR9_9PSEU|nr:serine/threonine-protein kinase [Actinomycetospora sp. DW7H6]MDD7967265.1 protein kinase [Actinomycetospora sp. DW7H6]
MSEDDPSAVPGPPLPDRLGHRFALGELIGRGTCSEVYRAHDLLLDRDAAVKIFPVENDPRIEREVALMASLDHPSLVPVFDVGHVAGRAFVVMSLLGGGNLSDRLAHGPMGVTETLLAVASVADGLGHVHRAGVLHRDVTPRNVLFDDDGRAHLSDFGVAFVADAPRITDTGIVVGSAPYLAPEQVRGETVGPPADVYALGLVMIEALTARPAYDGKPLAAARARLERRPDIPAGLDIEVVALLDAMTADDPAHRPTAEQVCVGLRRAALAAETLTPLTAVAPLAGPGLASAVPDATTETLRPGAAAGTAGPGAAPVGVPGAAPGSLGLPPVAASPGTADSSGTAETPAAPGRTRRPRAADAGGFAVATSVAAAVLLAGGVVVASAWTADGGSSVAAPTATVPPPTAEIVADPGGGGTFADGLRARPGDDAGDSGDAGAPALTRERSEPSAAAPAEPDGETRRVAATTDGGSTPATPSEERPSSPPSSATSSSTSSTPPSSTSPSTPTTTSPQGLPGLPGVTLPNLPTRPTSTTTPSSTTSSGTTSSTAPTTTTSASSTTSAPTTTTPADDETTEATGTTRTTEAAESADSADETTTAPTTTTTRRALVDPAIEALGGLTGGR